MKHIDRRSVLNGLLWGAAIAAVGTTTLSRAAKSLPLPDVKAGVAEPDGLVEEARVTIHVHPRGRRRRHRWRCWWHRGRRVCGWR